MSIEYLEGGNELLEHVAPLWRELNRHIASKTPHFRDRYDSMCWEERRGSILHRCRDGYVHVILADHDGVCAYCVSSIDARGEGWIDSIFVNDRCRRKGIGTELVRRSLEWLDSNGAVIKRLTVSPGNEAVLGFYERFGFRPRKIMLEIER